jgi:hypothetical protein
MLVSIPYSGLIKWLCLLSLLPTHQQSIYLPACLGMNVKELSTIPGVVDYCVSAILSLCGFRMVLSDTANVCSIAAGSISAVMIYLHFIFLF